MYNPYKAYNKKFNTSWKGLNDRDYIFNTPTKDYWDNCNEALKLLASADERLEILEKYFNIKSQVNG